MKIKNIENFVDQIEKEFSWRIKELSLLKERVHFTEESSTALHSTALRSGIVLLYAHWEGFVKKAASFYLNFVAQQNLTCNNLETCFLAIALQNELDELKKSNKLSTSIALLKRIRDDCLLTTKLPYKYHFPNYILNSERLEDIFSAIGLNYSSYETASNFIDKSLVERRNKIAHGQFLVPPHDDTISVFEKVIKILYRIKDDIIDIAVGNSYLRDNVILERR